MALYPLFADLRGRKVLVVGGGAVAARKVAALLEAEAHVCLVAPVLNPWLAQQRAAGLVAHLGHAFTPGQLDDAWLVIAATNDGTLNRAVADAAAVRRILVNVVDDAELSSFHSPARVRRGPITIAISSAGVAPVLARRLRAKLEAEIGPAWTRLAGLAQRYRKAIRARFTHMTERRRFYDWLVDGPVFALLRNGQNDTAEKALASSLQHTQFGSAAAHTGHVNLVGAGPGDAGLLTLAAVRALQGADVILHDRLVGRGILDLARRDAEFIDVGKRLGENHDATQARIHQLMLAHSHAGENVVRLHGGNPLIFGRSGEELAFLRAHRVSCTVIPGITAASAAAAAAGIPLTDRHCAASVMLATAHRTHAWSDAEWSALAREGQTLALYMAVAQIETVAHQLIAHGMPPTTPFLFVERATRPDQRTLSGQLRDLPALARDNHVQAPALLLIGEVTAQAARRIPSPAASAPSSVEQCLA